MNNSEFAATLAADEAVLFWRHKTIHLNMHWGDGPEMPLCGQRIYSPRALYTTEIRAVTCKDCQRIMWAQRH
jgi:hypothetical protein